MRRPWLTAVGIVFTLASLYLAFRGTDLRAVIGSLRDVGIGWTVPVLGGTLLSIWIRAYRWKVMLAPIREVSTARTYSATMIGFMANNVLPMRLGEIVRAYSIGRSTGISKSSAMATIVVERAFDLLAVLLFLGFMLVRHPVEDGGGNWVKISGYIALTACLGMFLLMGLTLWKRKMTVRIFRRVVARLPEELGATAEGLLDRFLDGLEVLSRGHHLLWVTILSILTWLAMALGFYFALLALHLDVPWDASLFLVTVCALAVMLPSGPGFIGTFEVGARYGLMVFGISDDIALSYAIFYHAVQFFPITLLGFYHLWRENFSLRNAMEGDEAA